jgi:hypothetical protein
LTVLSVKQPGLSNAAAGKIPQICATSPASEKKIRSRPLAQPTIQGLILSAIKEKACNFQKSQEILVLGLCIEKP